MEKGDVLNELLHNERITSSKFGDTSGRTASNTFA